MLVKTIKVKSKAHPDLDYVIINEDDFDGKIHTKLNELKSDNQDDEVSGEKHSRTSQKAKIKEQQSGE
ncbi:MAG: hypothetical protein ACKPFF_34795 [Planktothrix sp.]|jgi:hypothetical protein